jgi:hypothetical protein
VVADPHGWNSWQSYRAAHEGRLGTLRDHFILEDRLTFTISPELVYWEGELICADGVEVHVHRWQDVGDKGGQMWVRTKLYAYHVMLRFPQGTVDLFRYDNVGSHTSKGWTDAHHRHAFDAMGTETIEHIGHDGWPTLGDVLDETHDFWVRRFGAPS